MISIIIGMITIIRLLLLSKMLFTQRGRLWAEPRWALSLIRSSSAGPDEQTEW